MSEMRCALLVLTVLGIACKSNRKPGEISTVVETEAVKGTPGGGEGEAAKLVRRTVRNVHQHEELRLQGLTQQMVAVHRAIAQTVDGSFETFREMAVEGDLLIQRNMAVKCLGFAVEKKRDARDTLLLLLDDESPTIVANAARGLGILRDKETDIAPLVALLGSGSVAVRTNSASALANLLLIQETPRELTPQYYAAMDRLVTMLHDKASTRSRRAGVWALANMRHPETLDHLISALEDGDTLVQIGGLRGIQMLGDQRALEAVLRYLEDGPSGEGSSWARKALERIAIQGGFARTAAELDELGTNPRLWRKWFRAARMR